MSPDPDSESKLLSWPNSSLANAASSPFKYPLPPNELELLTEKENWIRAQALIEACQAVSERELLLLIKFEMLRWLGPECLF